MLARLVALLAALLLTACSSSETEGGDRAEPLSSGSRSSKKSSGGGGAISAAAQAEATKIFRARCSPCHGNEGKGDGPTSKGLTPQPRNFQDPDWQTKISDDAIEAIIQRGGAAVGKSPLMPPNPDLADRPEVVKALRAHVRGLRR